MSVALKRHLAIAWSPAAQSRSERRHRLLKSLVAAFALAIALAGFNIATAWASPTVMTTFTCKSVTFSFAGFPNAPNNKVTETVKLDGTTVYTGKFTFNGPSGSNTVAVTVPPGTHELKAGATWNTNGVKGETGRHDENVTCAAEPSFSIEKRQEIAGSGNGYTTAELIGKVGQTVDYEIIVTNTGNVPLTFSNFTDEKCDAGTISGGPGETAVQPGKSTIYYCHHVLAVGSYTNSATDTGTPPEGDGSPMTQTSNTVVVTVAAEPGFSIEKRQEIAGSGKGYTISQLAGEVGQTVDYEIIVTNTGNVPLTFSNFTDEKCDAGTISGGPGETAVQPGKSTTYYCEHLITEADKAAGLLKNNATDTGTPPEGEGSPITHTSNTVVVEVPLPSPVVHNMFSCKSVTFVFEGFPNRANNTVTETVKVNGTTVYTGKFTFNGPTGSNAITLNLPPGTYEVKAGATWNTNGVKGETGRHEQEVTCAAEPSFSIEKAQEIAGSGRGFTTSQLTGKVGQAVDYEIIVTNTGNVPLKLSNFTDEKCEGISGGPGETAVQPGKSTTYTCDHVLTEPGPYSNSASDTGTPPEGDGSAITQTSNTVVVETEA